MPLTNGHDQWWREQLLKHADYICAPWPYTDWMEWHITSLTMYNVYATNTHTIMINIVQNHRKEITDDSL